MARKGLKEAIKEGVLVLDGAMGTQLALRGATGGKCNDYLNIEKPEIVAQVHEAYFEAGSDAVITNTFGANKYALSRHGLGHMVEKVNKAAAEIARKAAGEERYVLGDIGPSGDFLEPLGTLKAGELKDAFCMQAEALAAGGVDGFIVETMTALDEVTVAVEAAKGAAGLPVFVSMAFDTAGDDFRTMMGVDVDSAVAQIVPLNVDAVGFNCGTVSLDGYVKLARKFVDAVKGLGQDTFVLAEPNAGLPELRGDEAVYNVGADEFAEAIAKIRGCGVQIIGGCCGTSPELIAAAVSKLKG